MCQLAYVTGLYAGTGGAGSVSLGGGNPNGNSHAQLKPPLEALEACEVHQFQVSRGGREGEFQEGLDAVGGELRLRFFQPKAQVFEPAQVLGIFPAKNGVPFAILIWPMSHGHEHSRILASGVSVDVKSARKPRKPGLRGI